jgi:hypothetical protein
VTYFRYKKLRKKGDQRRDDEKEMQSSSMQPSTTNLENLFDDDEAVEPMAQDDKKGEEKVRAKRDDFNVCVFPLILG